MSGSRGRIEVSRDGTQARFFVDRGEIHRSDPQTPELYRRVRFDNPFMTVVPLATSDILTGGRKRSVQEYTLPELLEEARHFKPKRYPGHPDRVYRYRVALMEIHWRFAVPAAAIAFCLLGFPLGLVNTRGGKSSGFAVSLVVITLYWIALTVGRDLAIEGKLPPFAGAWGPGASPARRRARVPRPAAEGRAPERAGHGPGLGRSAPDPPVVRRAALRAAPGGGTASLPGSPLPRPPGS